jgi:hypothetical protein
LKTAIAVENGVSRGWTIHLIFLKQPTIYQEEAFAFAKAMMGETIPELIKLKIHRFSANALKAP